MRLLNSWKTRIKNMKSLLHCGRSHFGLLAKYLRRYITILQEYLYEPVYLEIVDFFRNNQSWVLN